MLYTLNIYIIYKQVVLKRIPKHLPMYTLFHEQAVYERGTILEKELP